MLLAVLLWVLVVLAVLAHYPDSEVVEVAGLLHLHPHLHLFRLCRRAGLLLREEPRLREVMNPLLTEYLSSLGEERKG